LSISATTAVVNGVISCDGADGTATATTTSSGGGSGGSILLQLTSTLAGTGSISAKVTQLAMPLLLCTSCCACSVDWRRITYTALCISAFLVYQSALVQLYCCLLLDMHGVHTQQQQFASNNLAYCSTHLILLFLHTALVSPLLLVT
jgi:hypothetical protein